MQAQYPKYALLRLTGHGMDVDLGIIDMTKTSVYILLDDVRKAYPMHGIIMAGRYHPPWADHKPLTSRHRLNLETVPLPLLSPGDPE